MAFFPIGLHYLPKLLLEIVLMYDNNYLCIPKPRTYIQNAHERHKAGDR